MDDAMAEIGVKNAARLDAHKADLDKQQAMAWAEWQDATKAKWDAMNAAIDAQNMAWA